jgi:hypothetical protein
MVLIATYNFNKNVCNTWVGAFSISGFVLRLVWLMKLLISCARYGRLKYMMLFKTSPFCSFKNFAVVRGERRGERAAQGEAQEDRGRVGRRQIAS